MKRYKVAIVSDWFLPRVGGLELHIRDLCRELCRRGHEAHVITATPGAEADDGGVRVHRLDVPLMPGLRTIRNRQAVRQLSALLTAERYDVVHCHTALSPLALSAALLARRMGIPSVMTEHSVLRGGGAVILSALNQLCSWGSWPDVQTAVSGYVAAEVKRVTGRQDVQVVLNATRTDEWKTTRSEELRVTSVLRFTKRKRPIDIVRMIPQILSALPREQWPRFTIVGDGPERPRVEREARSLGVYEHTEFTGLRSRQEIKEILARSALFILPSYKEALPISVIEARAAGLPVVARTPNGVAEIIEHGVHGYLAGNTEEFAGYVVKLMKDPELRGRMAQNTLLGMERFTWDRAIEQHQELYSLAARRCQEARRSQQSELRAEEQLSALPELTP